MPEEICLLFTEFADLTKNPRSVLGSVGGGLANRGINICGQQSRERERESTHIDHLRDAFLARAKQNYQRICISPVQRRPRLILK
jgi:hypothetical protein